ncbi:MAG TPA: FkbM family methyltransferase, partial [Ignavibacteriaceae bacterium]|nr:FkbM family methyltransferase [Ignavibacteriaceae bacterium]
FKDFYHFLKEKNGREFLKLVFKFGNKPRYQKQNIKFLSYNLTVPDSLSFIWQFKEIFVDESYKFVSNNDRPVIYDCGANVGTSCIYFKKLYPDARIKAFEADPMIADILLQNLKDFQNIEVIKKAVWINDDGLEISQEGADAASIYMNKNKIKVASINLNKMLEAEDHIDMLKIDIEGAESEVVKSCRENLHKAESIFIEYHSFLNYEQDLGAILNSLKENGFRYFIKQPADRRIPFINRTNKNYPEMDLQLNIFAYKNL